VGWFGPRTGDANTCCTHAAPCVPCATDSQPTATYTVTIPAGDFGAGTYVLGLRNYLANGCSWKYIAILGVYCGGDAIVGLSLTLNEPSAATYTASVEWLTSWSVLGASYDRTDSADYDCADFDAFEIPCTTGGPCPPCTGPATVTAI